MVIWQLVLGFCCIVFAVVLWAKYPNWKLDGDVRVAGRLGAVMALACAALFLSLGFGLWSAG